MKSVTILQGRGHVVELPEGATDIRLHGPDNMGDTALLCNLGAYYCLPKGNWQIVGMICEVGEIDVSDIVDSVSVTCTDGAEYRGWRNYVYRDDFDETTLVNTALESSILAEGWYFDNPYPEPKPTTYERTVSNFGKNTDWKAYDKAHAEWRDAQSRVLDRSRCLLLGRVDG
ncbi:hypothetical protein [Parapedobacter indicus]|uniref:Uncharacterized protein n=1 Tax=Parapedobacter indicus TaxID=1477437 RepID=A0A1I3E3H2_9SPHI|nr:hypothetical protein [Parapedobacter indicus]PPL04953.1 hypothetical protein CLV26_101764 [Parapedobacter indicus]SFH93540.1 hypothetical protein SAMN05444682_101750 [Parapedobacter indicus]